MFDDKHFCIAEEVDPEFGEPELCEKCGSPISMRKWLPPFQIKLSKPVYGDFVFGGVHPFLVSNKFYDAYTRSRLTGIHSFSPVKVVKVNRMRVNSINPPQYYYIEIARGKAVVDEKLSNLRRSESIDCEVCRSGGIIQDFDGIYFDANTWSGEDIFFPRGLPGIIVVTERFRKFVESNGLTNLSLIPAEQYQCLWGKYYKISSDS